MKDLTQNHVEKTELFIPARDDYALGATLYGPDSAPGTVILFGATAVEQRYYQRFAGFLSSRGLRVITFDYRGIGRSRPSSLVGFDATMTDWALLDAAGIVDFVRQTFGNTPFGFVGHSFGGQLVGLLNEAKLAAGAVLMGAQLGYFGHWPLTQRWALSGVWNVVVPAAASLFGYLPGRIGLGTDLPSGVAREWARWCRHPDYLISEHPAAKERFARFDRPLVLLSASDDTLAPRQAVDALRRLFPARSVQHRLLRPEALGGPVGHFGFFRPELQEALWKDVGAYFEGLFAGHEPRFTAGDSPATPGSSPPMPSEEEVWADLDYGRA